MTKMLISWAVVLCGLIAGAAAQAQMPRPEDIAQFDVLPGWRTETGTHMAALRVRLAPGWKTYWRAPGDAGIPPRFDWTGSRNIARVTFHWPTPEVFEQNGLRTVGYVRELVLPMELTPRQAGADIAVQAGVEIGVCQDVCVPMFAEVSALLHISGGSDRQIAASLARRPMTASQAGVADIGCEVEPIKDGLRLTARITMPRLGANELTVFELSDQTIWVAEAASEREAGVLTAVTEMVPPSNAPFFLERSDVRITVLAAGRAVDIRGCNG